MQRLFLLIVLIVSFTASRAIPAQPGRRIVTLADGTKREAIIRGDERCHWVETPDGRIIGQPSVSQALIDRARLPIPSAANQHTQAPSTLQGGNGAPLGLKGAPETAGSGDLLLAGSFPTKGKRRLLALLINYANTTPTYSREQFDRMLNEEGYAGVGSFRDYYLDQSFGQLDIQTTVTPWITVSQAKQFYNADNTPSLIAEALKQIDASIDLRDFDNDHDGILDGLIVIHAGEGQEASGNATDIWSHSSTIYGMQFDGVSLYRYTIEPELLHGSASTIGVFCHEFGHNLGALDYYDTNYSSDGAYGGTGPWDLMGEGAWNGSGGLGTHPAPFTAWQRWQFGWTSPTMLAESCHIVVPATQRGADKGESFIMATTTEGDYFVLENIQHTSPWTSDIPGHGLIVTHVIESVVRQRMGMNNINASYPQGIYTVCADAHADPAAGRPSSYGDLTSSATPFPGTRNHTDFNDLTLPSTHSLDGRYGYIGLQTIVELPDGTISFDFVQGDAPQRPVDLTANVSRGCVRLDWTFPDNRELPVSCTVYREGQAVGQVAAPAQADAHFSFTDPASTLSGLVAYSVDATYASGLTSALSSVATRIPSQIATELVGSYNAESQEFEFAWKLPAELTRCVNDLHYELVDHRATSLRYAHRFRADDLQPFVGREVRSITFLPQQRSTEAAYQICVWRMPARAGVACPMNIAPDDLELVAQRKVNEFSPSYLRTTPFVTRPVLEAGYDYFVGVEITSSGLAEVVTDQSELQSGFGNMVSINGGTWMPDPFATGNYILSATLAGEGPSSPESSLVIVPGAPSLFDSFTAPFTPDQDLFFPLGFTLYSGNRAVAETTCSRLTLPLSAIVPEGTTPASFELVSTYKHHNESRALPILVDYEVPVGILPPSATASPSPVYDLAGRRIDHLHRAHGVTIQGGRKIVR